MPSCSTPRGSAARSAERPWPTAASSAPSNASRPRQRPRRRLPLPTRSLRRRGSAGEALAPRRGRSEISSGSSVRRQARRCSERGGSTPPAQPRSPHGRDSSAGACGGFFGSPHRRLAEHALHQPMMIFARRSLNPATNARRRRRTLCLARPSLDLKMALREGRSRGRRRRSRRSRAGSSRHDGGPASRPRSRC